MATPSIALPLASRHRCCPRLGTVAALPAWLLKLPSTLSPSTLPQSCSRHKRRRWRCGRLCSCCLRQHCAYGCRRCRHRRRCCGRKRRPASGVAAVCHVCRQRIQSARAAPPSRSSLPQVPWLQLVASASTGLRQNTSIGSVVAAVQLTLPPSADLHVATAAAGVRQPMAAAAYTYTSTLRHRSKQRPAQVLPPWQTRGSRVAVCAPAAVSRRWPEQLRRVGPTTMLLPRYRSGQRGGGQ